MGGDLNAHHQSWLTTQQADNRGTDILHQLHTLNILNSRNHPTRQPLQRNQQATSPDITFCSPSLHLNSTWQTIHDLSSDHLPIIITVQLTHPNNPSFKRTYINYKKANWPRYTEQLEENLYEFDITNFQSIETATKFVTDQILKASSKHIPKGHRKNYNPNFSREIEAKIKERNTLRQKRNPTDDEIDRLQLLNDTITDLITSKQTENWNRKLSTLDHKTNSSQMWKNIKAIHNSRNNPAPTHEALLTPRSSIPTPKEHCNILSKHYSKISFKPTTPQNRTIARRIHKLKIDTTVEPPFTPDDTAKAIKTLKNSHAEGPDKISNYHLKHLGPHATTALTAIINYSWLHNKIPAVWKIAHIVPILKPNKPPNLPESYRPISLLSTISKLMEKLVLARIKPHLPISPEQHGFREQHSTSTLLTNVTQTILDGFNQQAPPLRTVLVAVDISKAFDTVPRYILSNKILNTNFHSNDKKWLTNFLANRQCRVTHNHQISKINKLYNGVPQGAILSPPLFNLFMHDLPSPIPDLKVKTYSYADDLTILGQHEKHVIAARNVQSYLNLLEAWLTQNRMTVSPQKSSVTLLTPDRHESSKHPRLTLGGQAIPLNKTPTILGITYDTHMTFTPHVNNVTTKATRKLNALRAVSNTKFGQQKESLSVMYKQFIRTTLNYASTAWYPTIKPTNREKLQVTQNRCLRTITGSTQTTNINHLHSETKILPINYHLDMIGTQYFGRATDLSHPSHHITLQQPPDRSKKTTPAKYYTQLFQSMTPVPNNTTMTKHIHTQITKRALLNRPDNTILNSPPPDISPEEQTLPRHTRVTLSRLRSGHHPSLNQYRFRINLATDPSCSRCHHHTDNTEHIILHCPAYTQHRINHNITSLRDLWSRPVAVAGFLEAAGFS